MGVDWFVFRPKSEYSAEQIQQIIDKQANSLLEYGGGLYDELSATLPSKTPSEKDNALQAYIAASQELRNYIDFITEKISDDFLCCQRVSVISVNHIFPIEWRISAFRTILPNQLPAQLEQWRSYINAVNQGHYRAFLLDLFLYLACHQVLNLWEEMQYLAKKTLEKTNKFTQKSEFIKTRQQILNFPSLPTFQAPHWAEVDFQNQSVTVESDPRYKQMMTYQNDIEALRRDWKYNVPSSWRPMRFSPYTFERFLEYGYLERLQDFFTWLDKCCQYDFGLYLDW